MTTTRTPAANRFQPIDPQPDALPMPDQTYKTFAQIRTELLTTFSAADHASPETPDSFSTIQITADKVACRFFAWWRRAASQPASRIYVSTSADSGSARFPDYQ
jgi:hypothetical protein